MTMRQDGVIKSVWRQGNQAKRRCVMKGASSLSGFRPRPLLGLVASLAMVVAFAAHAGSDLDAAAPAEAAASKAAPADKSDDRRTDQADYVWSVQRGEGGLKLRGSVPSEEDRKTLLGMVKAHFPDLQVEDKLKVTKGGPPKEQWLGAVSFGLQQLTHLKRGSVRLTNVTMRVAGDASSPDDYNEIKKALAGPLPSGLVLKDDDVRAPIADPFVFTADLGANALSLSGSVPSEDSRKQLREMARQLFERPGLDDRLEVASGAPKDWDEAVSAALRALSRLESGKVALSGLAVTIEGVAPDKGTAVAVSYQLRRDLPKLFSTSESIKWKEASALPDSAAQVLPRIKEYARTNSNWPKGELPPLLPLVDAQ
jgi:osmotically-inducible protein OsmY